jgi:hypothetical protein
VAVAAGARLVVEPRRGYGRACLAGIAANPEAEAFVFVDADLSESPEEMLDLVHPILTGEMDLVLGARDGRHRPWHARGGAALCVWLINWLWGTSYTDLGPFRAIRSSSLLALGMRDETWGWTIEMQVKAAEQGLRWREIHVYSGPRAGGASKISGSVAGTLRAAGRMLETIVRLRLTRRERLASADRAPASEPSPLSRGMASCPTRNARGGTRVD